jgi:hypothetical protein
MNDGIHNYFGFRSTGQAYTRLEHIYTSFPGVPIQTVNKTSGDSWVLELDAGTYFFNVGQSGGSEYGTYSGTINDVPFSGVDNTHATQFTVGAPNNGGDGAAEPIPVITWVAVGVVSLALAVGAIWYFRKKPKK